jgi:Flp pilus assembly protein TadG
MMKQINETRSARLSIFGNDDGQMVVMGAIVLVAMLGIAALAIDVGFFLHTKREVQNDADAMALAAVRELPNTSDAQAIAMEWADKNSVAGAEIKSIVFGTTCTGESIDGTVTVRLQRTQTTTLAKVVGISSADLKACATARRGQATGGPGLMPLGILYDKPNIAGVCYYNNNSNFWEEQCTVKVANPGPDQWIEGNVGPLRMDEGSGMDPTCKDSNSGGAEFSENIKNGTKCGYAISNDVPPLTGAQTGPTCSAFAELIGSNADTFSDVFKEKEDGVYTVVNTASPRYALLPVIKVAPGSSGSSVDVTIKMFVPVYIVDASCSGSGGNQLAVVKVIPAKSTIYVTGLDFVNPGSGFGSDYPLFTIKLIN